MTEASKQATANVQTVASAAEELSSSIADISRQVSQSSEIAARAVQEHALVGVALDARITDQEAPAVGLDPHREIPDLEPDRGEVPHLLPEPYRPPTLVLLGVDHV